MCRRHYILWCRLTSELMANSQLSHTNGAIWHCLKFRQILVCKEGCWFCWISNIRFHQSPSLSTSTQSKSFLPQLPQWKFRAGSGWWIRLHNMPNYETHWHHSNLSWPFCVSSVGCQSWNQHFKHLRLPLSRQSVMVSRSLIHRGVHALIQIGQKAGLDASYSSKTAELVQFTRLLPAKMEKYACWF